MKNYIVLLFFLWGISLHAQLEYITNFEDQNGLEVIIGDMTSDSLWQIGKPDKTYFSNAYSVPNAILTDTIQTYPTNQSSSFIIKLTDETLYKFPYIQVEWQQKLDAEANVDGGIIELSYNRGQSWSNVLDDPIYRPAVVGNYTIGLLSNNQMGFTGQLDWSYVAICWGTFYGVQPMEISEIWIKYTFFSDSNDTQQDGWMLDNFYFVPGIIGSTMDRELNSKNLALFPNPTKNELSISLEGIELNNATLQILNTSGQVVYVQKLDSNIRDSFSLATQNFPEGVYQVFIHSGNSHYQNRFIKQ